MAPAPTKRATPWPKALYGNAWDAVYGTAFEGALKANGAGKGPFTDARGRSYTDQKYPRITNGQAVTLIMGWMMAAGSSVNSDFALWYQLGAIAYDWDPARDRLDTSKARRDAWYPADASLELWMQAQALAWQLDKAEGHPASAEQVELSLDGSFDDPSFQGQVRAALRADGAQAQWKIPLPACKDPKTGKPGKPHKDKNGKWTCDPVVVDDPITRAKQSVNGFLVLVAVVAIIAWTSDNKSRRKRRKE